MSFMVESVVRAEVMEETSSVKDGAERRGTLWIPRSFTWAETAYMPYVGGCEELAYAIVKMRGMRDVRMLGFCQRLGGRSSVGEHRWLHHFPRRRRGSRGSMSSGCGLLCCAGCIVIALIRVGVDLDSD